MSFEQQANHRKADVLVRRFIVIAIAFLLVRALPAQAQTPSPLPSPSPSGMRAPLGFDAHAHTDVTITTPSGTFRVTARFAVVQRDQLSRLDILSVQSDTLPVPTSRLTLVVDRLSNTVTIWNAASKTYVVQSVVPFGRGATPVSRPSAAPPSKPLSSRSPFADLEIFAVSIALTGHTTTATLATTGLTANVDFRKAGDKATSHLTAALQLADDFAAFPITIEATVDPGTTAFSGKLAYAVDDFVRDSAPTTSFTIPTGYSKAELISVLLGRPAKRALPTR